MQKNRADLYCWMERFHSITEWQYTATVLQKKNVKQFYLVCQKSFKMQSCEHFAIVPEKVTVLVSNKQMISKSMTRLPHSTLQKLLLLLTSRLQALGVRFCSLNTIQDPINTEPHSLNSGGPKAVLRLWLCDWQCKKELLSTKISRS